MKNLTLVLLMVIGTSSCGIAWEEWRGEQRKVRLTKDGEALLLKSLTEKKVQIEDAKGLLEAAKYKADAEIERARGVAKANSIIGSSLRNNEAYLRYLYISNLEKAEASGSVNTIYIPTEAGLPILEAGKR